MPKIFKYFILIIIFSILIYLFMNRNKSTIQKNNIFNINDTTSVHTIFMADKYGNEVLIKKYNNIWKLNEKYTIKKEAINNLLNSIQKLRIERPVSVNALERVIKNLATKGVKIEIYTKDDVKSYIIGNPTKNHKANYMLLNDENEPYIVHIPGFSGYPSASYGIQGGKLNIKDNWLDQKIFNNIKYINNISLIDFTNPKNSFSIIMNPIQLLNYRKQSIEFDTLAINNYVNLIKNINYNSKFNSDSILTNKKPIFGLTVNKDTLFLYSKDKIKKTNNQESNIDVLLSKNTNNELMIIQKYVFNKVLITLDDFNK